TPPPDWHTDPLTGRPWPRRFYTDVDIRDGRTIGGVKWVWELNRHHHLVSLAKAYYLLSRDWGIRGFSNSQSPNPLIPAEEYAQIVCDHWQSWLDTNPPYEGVNWTSALETAVRLVNWAWALAFLRRAPSLTESLFARLMRSVTDQAIYVTHHLSRYSSANNHLIGEAAGLAITGLTFPWLPGASHWRDQGLDILTQEIGRQIHPDGVPAEQAIAYLAFILDWNLLAWRLADLNGIRPPALWYERLAAAANFIYHLMDENGHVPAIGDSDDAWVVRLDDDPQANNYRSILASAAVLLHRPDFAVAAGRWDEKSHWLLGDDGHHTFESLAAPFTPAPLRPRAFREGGYVVFHAPGRLLTFDCGPLGYLSTAAHGHADALSLTLSIDGQPFLVDPGTYAYQEGDPWRDYFRGTAAHNTLVIDGQDQSAMRGPFLWGRQATARLLRWESTPAGQLAIAEHDGYAHLGLTHRRTILFPPQDTPNPTDPLTLHVSPFTSPYILVIDEVYGSGRHTIEQWWHFLPHATIDPSGPERCAKITAGTIIGHVVLVDLVCGTGRSRFQLDPRRSHFQLDPRRSRFQLDRHVEYVTYTGAETPRQGWYSAHYGHLEPAPTLGLVGRFDLPLRLVVALCPTVPPDLQAHVSHLLESAGIRGLGDTPTNPPIP
ncbi:MAG: alginate lyase family protein, partial [Chloroflexota bacterium]